MDGMWYDQCWSNHHFNIFQAQSLGPKPDSHRGDLPVSKKSHTLGDASAWWHHPSATLSLLPLGAPAVTLPGCSRKRKNIITSPEPLLWAPACQASTYSDQSRAFCKETRGFFIEKRTPTANFGGPPNLAVNFANFSRNLQIFFAIFSPLILLFFSLI